MKWKKYTFVTTTEAVDLVSATLGEIGIQGIEIEDHVPLSEEDTKGMFIDILPDVGPDDGTAKVSFYLDPEEDDISALLSQVKEELEDLRTFTEIGPCEITEGETEDKDWINNWKQYFKPLTVGNIVVKPTWEELPEDMPRDAKIVQIDPGTAFGTGGHETTKLCMLQLEKYIKEFTEAHGCAPEVLDVGTGSGILGITALCLGAGHILGTDLDPASIIAVGENMEVNGITSDQFSVICGNIIDDKAVQDQVGYEKYDIVAANILAPVIIMLVGEIAQHMKKGGIFITSGIIDMKEAEVVAAFTESPDFEILEVNHMGEWVNVTAKRV